MEALSCFEVFIFKDSTFLLRYFKPCSACDPVFDLCDYKNKKEIIVMIIIFISFT